MNSIKKPKRVQNFIIVCLPELKHQIHCFCEEKTLKQTFFNTGPTKEKAP